MSLPFSFLIGLFVVVGHRELGGTLPGEGVVDELLWTASLLIVPWLLAGFARGAALHSLITGRRPLVPPQSLLRLSAVATPLVMHVLFEFGAYSDWIERLAPASHTARIALALLPLYVADIPRAVMATMAEALLEASYESRPPRPVASILMPGWRDVWPAIRIRLGWPLLALLPALLLGASMDLLQLWRDGYVFVMATTAGLSVATIAYLLLAAMLLPFWFRVAFGVRAELPEPVGTALRETAARLGFSPDRVFVLPTGMRAVNAMMVGPLPVGRLLCLTDGLLSTLDARSLSGVLAHEVGHARMGHPGLLMLLAVIVPLMLLSPLRLLDLDQVDVVLQAVVLLGATLLVWLSVRGLARRFEHEADVSSVQVLGAEPCSRALLTVARLTLPQSSSLRGRLLSLHPDERHRLELMRRYEQEPTFRDQFDRKTRRLRRGVFGVLLFAVAAGAWFWLADWPYERVIVRFHTGDFVGARAALDELEERPARWRESLQVLEQELDAADQLQPGLRDWDSVERALVPAAWQRGEQVLLRDGPAAARPWLSLALTAMPSPTTTQLAVHAFCRAAADQDPDRMLRAARIVLRLGVPPGLAPVFRDYR